MNRFLEFLRSIGPAIIVAAVVCGPGSMLMSSKTGAIYGYQMIWVLVLAATSLLPLAQALERSDWLRLVAALRGRWEAEDDPDARRRVAAGLERWIERLGGSR